MPHLTRLRQEVVNVMKIYMFMFNHLKMTYTFSIYNKEISAKIPGIYKKEKKRTGFTAYNTKWQLPKHWFCLIAYSLIWNIKSARAWFENAIDTCGNMVKMDRSYLSK